MHVKYLAEYRTCVVKAQSMLSINIDIIGINFQP